MRSLNALPINPLWTYTERKMKLLNNVGGPKDKKGTKIKLKTMWMRTKKDQMKKEIRKSQKNWNLKEMWTFF